MRRAMAALNLPLGRSLLLGRNLLLGRSLVLGSSLLLGLSACDSSVDRQRATICRQTLPALVPATDNPRLLRVGRGSAPDTVRVDYAIGSRPHGIVCSFDQGATLTGVVSDRTAVTGATLYLLKRYYLDSADAKLNDPKAERE